MDNLVMKGVAAYETGDTGMTERLGPIELDEADIRLELRVRGHLFAHIEPGDGTRYTVLVQRMFGGHLLIVRLVGLDVKGSTVINRGIANDDRYMSDLARFGLGSKGVDQYTLNVMKWMAGRFFDMIEPRKEGA